MGCNLSLARQHDALAELDDYLREVQAELDAAGGDDPYLLTRVGSTLGSLGPPQRAIEMLQRAAVLYEQRHEHRELADALNRLSGILTDAGQRTEARITLERSLAVARAHRCRSEEASALNNLSLLDEDDGEVERAMARQMQCIVILRELSAEEKLASSLNNLASLHMRADAVELALARYQEALAMHEKVERRHGIANVLNNIGHAYQKIGQLDKAIDYYERACAEQKIVGDQRELVIFWDNLAAVYRLKERHADEIRALEQKRKALVQLEEHLDIAQCDAQLTSAWVEVEDYDSALVCAERSLAMRISIGGPRDVSIGLDLVASTYARAGKHARARTLMLESLRLAIKEGTDRDVRDVLRNLAFLHDLAEQQSAHARVLRIALALTELDGDDDELAETLEALARAEGWSRGHQRAIIHYERALPFLEATDADDLGSVLVGLGWAYWVVDDIAAARGCAERALELARARGAEDFHAHELLAELPR